MHHSSLVACGAAIGLLLSGISRSEAGPEITVGANVPPPQRVPVAKIDNSTWDALLRKYVNAEGQVDYSTWKASAIDRAQLDQYLYQLSSASIDDRSLHDARLAFWINAYNALTIQGILREYPTTSIRNHTAKLIGYNIWKDLQLFVEGHPYSLNAIEHDVLRKMREPRIHFAIVCASVGCPKLRNTAYTADHLDQQLTENTKAFFSDRTKFVFDAASRTIHVSPILDWFAEDFGPDTPARLRAIAPYLPESAQPLARSGSARVKFLDYDWGLNDQSRHVGAAKQ